VIHPLTTCLLATMARRAGLVLSTTLLLSTTARADVTWPADQLLPSFPLPAANQDLFINRGNTVNFSWEAEGNALGHNTGHLDGDGWLCQTGVDTANQHMIFGPYDTNVPAGDSTAHFRVKIDNNTADDNKQITIDVRDNTSGQTLATRDITRKQFSSAGDYVTFDLPFTFVGDGHAIELRVYWYGGAYLKVDSISVSHGSDEEVPLFASLKGVVNLKQPRIFSYEGDAFAEGETTWLKALGLTWTKVDDNWSLISKYKSEIKGLIVYDPMVPDTMNLATTLAGAKHALVASPSQLAKLMAGPYNFTILEDLRGRFANKLAVYNYLYSTVWPNLTHRVILGLSTQFHKGAAREYAAALGAAVIWLDPRDAGESPLLDKFLNDMGPNTAFMGWWPEEGSGIERASRHGIATVASDYACNLTVHSGMPRKVDVKPIPAKPILDKKIYVAFWISDGDNLQYVEHLMLKLWNDPKRGQVPMGWTVSPAMLDAMPGALNYYYTSGSVNDALISGPSGWGYGYPNFWKSPETLAQYITKSDEYALRAGLRVVTVWNTITGGIDADVGSAYAQNGPNMLGVSAQNTGGGLTVYDNKLPGFALSCNYCDKPQSVADWVNSSAQGWDGNEARFVVIQAQPWQGITPTTFANVRDSLNGNFVVVRPDTWFQLLRQANHLPIEPHAQITDGIYRLISKVSGKCMALHGSAVEQLDCADDDAQRWHVVTSDAGYTRIRAVKDDTLLLNVEGGSKDEGPNLVAGGADQQWQPVWEAGRDYHLLQRDSDRCADVPNGSADDVQLRQWTCNGSVAQAFRFADPVWPPPVTDDDAGMPMADAGEPGDGDGDGMLADGGHGGGDGDGDGARADGGMSVGDAGSGYGIVKRKPGGCSTTPNVRGSCWQLAGLGVALVLLRRRRA
jgi:hypothetical protein